MTDKPLLLAALVTVCVGGPAPAVAQRLQDTSRVVRAIGQLWQRGDAGGLVDLGVGGGLQLEIRGMAMGTLESRRAAAALRGLFRDQRTVEVRTGPLTLVAGTEDRAFVELEWWTRPLSGLTVDRTTVFVGLVREPAGWRVSQIRVLPW